nr:hypothetical protein HJG59_003834 [Molossus molossus]
MPPLLVEGTVWPGMGPPRRGPLRPPRPVCSLRKFCANREVPIQTQDCGTERLRLSAEAGKAFVPLLRGRRQGCPKTSPSCSIAQMALPWLLTFCSCDGCLQEPSHSMPPCSLSPTAPAFPP